MFGDRVTSVFVWFSGIICMGICFLYVHFEMNASYSDDMAPDNVLYPSFWARTTV